MGFNELYNNLKNWTLWDCKAYHLEKTESEIALNALEKQKPKNLEIERIGCITLSGKCPTCGRDFFSIKEGIDRKDYCGHCGQRITWPGKGENEN